MHKASFLKYFWGSLAIIAAILLSYGSPDCAAGGKTPLSPEDIYSLDLFELMEIEVITATRTKMKLKETPSAVYVITEKEIRQRGYRTLTDALSDVPGFYFQRTYGIFPDMVHQRGLIGNNQRSLVYIDGILDNNISENAVLGGTIRYPLHNVEQIEIVAGPVSSLYGANAFNGVINIITKDGKKTSEKTVQAFTGSWMDEDYMGYGAAFSLNDSLSSATDDYAYSIGGYYYKADGPDFRGIRNIDENGAGYWWSDAYNNSGEDTYNITAKFSCNHLRAEFIQWQYLQGDGTFANGTYQIDTDKNGFTGSAWDFKSSSISVGYLYDINNDLSLDSEMIIRQTELLSSSHESYPFEPGPDAYKFPDKVTTVSGYARPDESYEIDERLEWIPSARFSSTLGFETIYTVVPEGYGSFKKYKYKNYAGYLQSMYRITEDSLCIGGYRLDHNTAYGDSHTGRISAICNPGNYTLKALFSTGFRAPTAWELYNETRQRKKNLNLDPERMWSVEVGAAYTFPEKGHLSVQGYYNIIRDLILEVETEDLNPNPEKKYWNQNRNIGKANIIGLEFNSDYCLQEDLAVYLNYTFSEGKYHDLPDSLTSSPTAHHENDIPNIPKHTLSTGITYQLSKDVTLHARANYIYDINTIHSNPLKKVDDQLIFHTTIRLENLLFGGFSVQLMIRNITDEKAFDPGIRTADGTYYPIVHPVEGRNIWLTVAQRF